MPHRPHLLTEALVAPSSSVCLFIILPLTSVTAVLGNPSAIPNMIPSRDCLSRSAYRTRFALHEVKAELRLASDKASEDVQVLTASPGWCYKGDTLCHEQGERGRAACSRLC